MQRNVIFNQLLESGADLSMQDKNGKTAMHHANGRPNIIKILEESRVHVCQAGQSLFAADTSGDEVAPAGSRPG